MDPERWRQIERLYHEALEQAPGERTAYLEQACGADAGLRHEVTGLLAHEEEARDCFEEPALEIAARDMAEHPFELTAGQTLDRYKVLAPLGTGGMGIVYTAQDARLDRTVALKFLLDEFTGDKEALESFRREARALSALNHPNICTIHDIAEADGRTFLVMEYVAGKRLDRLIGRKGLPLPTALQYAVQVADGLARAHAAGLVHRDLKPGNIIVSDDGRVKLLDFGLAQLAAADAGSESDNSSAIVGTVAYMSPQQAEGRKVDARSDIFSFGAVLYEMVAGRRAFPGDTSTATLSAILHTEPAPVSRVSPGTPREVERIIARCLRKDPERRFQTAADLKVALQEIREELESGKLAEASPARPRVPLSLVMIAILALLVAAGCVVWFLNRTAPKPADPLVVRRLTRDSGLTTTPAISRDGKLVAYVSDRSGEDNLDIWVQQVAGGQPIRLTSNPAADIQPDFSPDGSKIVYRSERGSGGIYVVSTFGGEERQLAPRGYRPRFSPDGKWIAYFEGSPLSHAKVFLVNAAGGAPQEWKVHMPWAGVPVWSPDGRSILFLGSMDAMGNWGTFDWWVAPSDGGPAVRTGAFAALGGHDLKPAEGDGLSPTTTGGSTTFLPDAWVGDRIVFSAGLADSTDLWQVAIAPKTWQINEAPQRLTAGVDRQFGASLAADGRIVFATVDQHLDLWTLPVDANQGKALGTPQQLTQTAANSFRPSISLDAKRLVFLSNRSGNRDVWLREMDSGRETALTATPWDESHAWIAADGSKVVYASSEGQEPVMYLMSLGPGGRTAPAERLGEGRPFGWSQDGRRILYFDGHGYSSMEVATRERADVIRFGTHNLHRAQFSPDSKWLAFHVPLQAERGRSPVFIVPLRNGVAAGESEWIQVTEGTGIDAAPTWSPDGGMLYFLSRRDGFKCIWAQRVDKESKRPSGSPFDVVHFHGARYTVNEPVFGPSVSSDKLVFALSQNTGNVWTAKPESQR